MDATSCNDNWRKIERNHRFQATIDYQGVAEYWGRSVNESAVSPKACADTLKIVCPLCGSDTGDTLGVTGIMNVPETATVIMRCGLCKTVYTSPKQAFQSGSTCEIVGPRSTGSVVKSLVRKVQPGESVLCCEYDYLSVLDRKAEGQKFNCILMPLTCECAIELPHLLGHVEKLLSPNGRVEVVLNNTESTCFKFFGGRHWYGYQIAQSRLYPGLQGLSHAAADSGFKAVFHKTGFYPDAWLKSVHIWMIDWRAPAWVVALVTGPWGGPKLLASCLELTALMLGRASLLVVKLERV